MLRLPTQYPAVPATTNDPRPCRLFDANENQTITKAKRVRKADVWWQKAKEKRAAGIPVA
jgi:hypothetical protein